MFSPRQTLVSCVLALAALALAVPARAESGWQIRAGGLWVDPSFSTSVTNDDGTPIAVTSDSDLGYTLGLEYRFAGSLGLDLRVGRAEPDVELGAEVPGLGRIAIADGLGYTPVTFGLNAHITPDRPVDLYLGILAAWIDYGDLDFVITEPVADSLSVTSSSDVGWGVTAGADIAFGSSPWSLAAGLTWIRTDLEAREPGGDAESFEFNPFMVTLGVGYSF
jgi:outer membrane protein W